MPRVMTTSAAHFAAWQCCARPAGAVMHPDQLHDVRDWLPAQVPGTTASALATAGRWSLDQPYDFDAADWWFRTTFRSPGSTCRLRFDGLATLAEVWLNGERLAVSDNMFRGL